MQLKYVLSSIVSAIMVLDIYIFLFVKKSFESFALSGHLIFSGELYRLLTFLFVHLNSLHLVENLIALIVTAVLAYEFELSGTDFLVSFAATSLIVALPNSYLFPALLVGGSSLGIYAVFGSITVKGGDFIPRRILVPLFGLSIFYNYFVYLLFSPELLTKEVIYQTLYHFSSFMTGAILFYLLLHIRTTKKYIGKGRK